MEHIKQIINQNFHERGKVGKIYPVVYSISEDWQMKNRSGVFYGRFVLSGDTSVKVRLKGQEMTINKDFTSEVLFEELLSVNGFFHKSNDYIDFVYTNLFRENDFLKIVFSDKTLSFYDVDGESSLLSAEIPAVGYVEFGEQGATDGSYFISAQIKKMPSGFSQMVVDSRGKLFDYIPGNAGQTIFQNEAVQLKSLVLNSNTSEKLKVETTAQNVTIKSLSGDVLTVVQNIPGSRKNFALGSVTVNEVLQPEKSYVVDSNLYCYDYIPEVPEQVVQNESNLIQDFIRFNRENIENVVDCSKFIKVTNYLQILAPSDFDIHFAVVESGGKPSIDVFFFANYSRDWTDSPGLFERFGVKIEILDVSFFESVMTAETVYYYWRDGKLYTLKNGVAANQRRSLNQFDLKFEFAIKQTGAFYQAANPSDLHELSLVKDGAEYVVSEYQIEPVYHSLINEWRFPAVLGVWYETPNFRIRLVKDEPGPGFYSVGVFDYMGFKYVPVIGTVDVPITENTAQVYREYTLEELEEVDFSAFSESVPFVGFHKFETLPEGLALSVAVENEWQEVVRLPKKTGFTGKYNVLKFPEIDFPVVFNEKDEQQIFQVIDNPEIVVIEPEREEQIIVSGKKLIDFTFISKNNYFSFAQLIGVSVIDASPADLYFKIYSLVNNKPELIFESLVPKAAKVLEHHDFKITWVNDFVFPVEWPKIDYVFNQFGEAFKVEGFNVLESVKIFDKGNLSFIPGFWEAPEYGKVFLTLKRVNNKNVAEVKTVYGEILDSSESETLILAGVDGAFTLQLKENISSETVFVIDSALRCYEIEFPTIPGTNQQTFFEYQNNSGGERPVLNFEFNKSGNIISDLTLTDTNGLYWVNQRINVGEWVEKDGHRVRVKNNDYFLTFPDGVSKIYVDKNNQLSEVQPERMVNGVLQTMGSQKIQFYWNWRGLAATDKVLVIIRKTAVYQTFSIEAYKVVNGSLFLLKKGSYFVDNGDQVIIGDGDGILANYRSWAESEEETVYLFDSNFWLYDYSDFDYKTFSDVGLTMLEEVPSELLLTATIVNGERRLKTYNLTTKQEEFIEFTWNDSFVQKGVFAFVNGELRELKQGPRAVNGHLEHPIVSYNGLTQNMIVGVFKKENENVFVCTQFPVNFKQDESPITYYQYSKLGEWFGNIQINPSLQNSGLFMITPNGEIYHVVAGAPVPVLSVTVGPRSQKDGVLIPEYYQPINYNEIEVSKVPNFYPIRAALPDGYQFQPETEDKTETVIVPAVTNTIHHYEFVFQPMKLKSGQIIPGSPAVFTPVMENIPVAIGSTPAEMKAIEEYFSGSVFQFSGYYADFE